MDSSQVLLSPLSFEEREDEFRDTFFLEVDATLKYYIIQIRDSLGKNISRSIIQNFLPDLIDILTLEQKQAFVKFLNPTLSKLYYIDLYDKIETYTINSETEFLKFCQLLTFLEYKYIPVLAKVYSKVLPIQILNKLNIKNIREIVTKYINVIYEELNKQDCPEWFLSNIKFLTKQQLVILISKLTIKYLSEIISETILLKEAKRKNG